MKSWRLYEVEGGGEVVAFRFGNQGAYACREEGLLGVRRASWSVVLAVVLGFSRWRRECVCV